MIDVKFLINVKDRFVNIFISLILNKIYDSDVLNDFPGFIKLLLFTP